MRISTVHTCLLGCLFLTSFADEDDSELEVDEYLGKVVGSLGNFGDYYEKGKESSGFCDDDVLIGGWSYSRLRGSCNQYLHCAGDRAFIQTCAAGTFYDGQECRHADEVTCPADPCLRKHHGFTYTDGQSCYGFYQCMKGKSRYHTCHDGFYFNPYKQGCFRDPTCHKNNLIHPCAFGTTLPFPGRPNLFYLYNGHKTMTPMKCPKGTWYRPDICTCDWITPGKVEKGGCKPMFYFKYNGNFLEKYNRVQQMPTAGVALFRKSVLFDHGGKIIIWAMNNMELDGDFSLCFEFMVKTYKGEIALLSNDFGNDHFTYKLTYIPALGVVKAYFVLKDGTVAILSVVGVVCITEVSKMLFNIQKWENLEAGAKDASDFLKWQSEMKQRDLEEELAEIERRRLHGKLSHEEAILARQDLILENKQKVKSMKEETKKMMQEYLQKKFSEEKEIRQLVEDTMQGHKNAKEATKKLQEYKRKIVQDVNEESKELMKQALEEAEEEMRRRMELIHQIRAMEAVPIIRQKFVDLTATSGHGLLSEMSIAELRERLSLFKTAEKESEEQRRDDILAAKQAKDQMLLETLETISKHRLEQTKSAAVRFECRKKGLIPKKPEIKDPKLLELERKLEERKAQRKKEQEKAKLVPSRQSMNQTKNLINQKRAIEESRWRELEMTQERSARLVGDGAMKSHSASRLATSSAIMAS